MTNLLTCILFLGTINFSNAYNIFNSQLNFQNISRNRRQTTNGGCQIPNNPPNGQYAIRGDDGNTYKAGDYVPELLVVLYLKCDGTYMPSPPDIIGSFCVNGEWKPSPSVCSRTCKSIHTTETTEVKCSFNNLALETCDNPVDGTVAKFTCEAFYEDSSLEHNPYRFCENGEWNGIPQCYPICGQKHPVGRANVINGTNAKLGDYPWHVGVYNAQKDYRCGGAIITQRIILSAAHCFTSLATGELYPKENYLIAAGKYYREYSDSRDQHYQYSTVESIHVPSRYKGSKLQYQADIAVVVLTKQLILTESVQPVCVDWGNKFENQQLTPNNFGIVTGWGYTMEGLNLSDELKELSIPFVPFDQCYDSVPRAFQTFLRQDKMCGGYLNISTSVCEGDSGGGLVFPQRYSRRYFIRGVVSTSPATIERQCDSNQYGIYTLVSEHLDFINNIRNIPRPYLTTSTVISLSTNSNDSPKPLGAAPSTTATSLNCKIPREPDHGIYVVQSASKQNLYRAKAGDLAEPFDVLTTKCNDESGETKSNTAFSVCVYGSWKPEPRDCFDSSLKNLLPSIEVCGKSSFFERIVPNVITKTALNELPWLAVLQTTNTNTRYTCGGVLISNRYVLTAAHCISSPYIDIVSVRLGEYNFDTNPDCFNNGSINICAPSPIDVPVAEKIIHEEFSSKKHINDIGLIRLERTVDFTDYIQPICLPTSNAFLDNQNIDHFGDIMVAGWGITPAESDDSKIKSKLRVPLISNIQCATAYNGTTEINARHICTEGIKNQDLCQGAAGSALMENLELERKTNWYAFGILSSARGCGLEIQSPTIYTRITSYVPWILSKLQP